MNHHIHCILKQWSAQKNQQLWALASIVGITGSSYRKEGAVMLISEQGQSLGMLSGGCLEADIVLQAQKCIFFNKSKMLHYDTQDQDEHSAIKLLGCGGSISVLIQPLTNQNNHHNLPCLLNQLNQNKSAVYAVKLSPNEVNECLPTNNHDLHNLKSIDNKIQIFAFKARTHLAIFGAGLDAVPMVKMAQLLGWHVSLLDDRKNQFGFKHFPQDIDLIRTPLNRETEVSLSFIRQSADVAIIMGHNLKFDASALTFMQKSKARYIGMLGPVHRQEKVIDLLPEKLNLPLYGPIGLDIGSELPEEIALSCLAEIQAAINNKHKVTLKRPRIPKQQLAQQAALKNGYSK
ncbi:XdhC family protein [Catenovulum sediminis]|uniref:XdhC family protein n=1 Tax=Catenovulum sediminis TaxID=1740262 RepID=A0ABV1REF5_9ALTE